MRECGVKEETLRILEKTKEEQRKRVNDSALSSDHRSDCIGTTRKRLKETKA